MDTFQSELMDQDWFGMHTQQQNARMIVILPHSQGCSGLSAHAERLTPPHLHGTHLDPFPLGGFQSREDVPCSFSSIAAYLVIGPLSAVEPPEFAESVVTESEGGFSLDDRIVFVLSEDEFFSVRQTANNVMISKSIAYRYLTQTMRWKLRHLQGVPDSPIESEK
jgi:hypothetical protein